MKISRILSFLLAFALLLICIPFEPIYAQELDDGQIIENGVYYIQNMYSSYYLQLAEGPVQDGAYVSHMNINPYNGEGDATIEQLKCMWKIYYLGDGVYSVRPLCKLDMGLSVSSDILEEFPIAQVTSIGTTDTLLGVPASSLQTIELDETGYVLQQYGDDSNTLYAPNIGRSVHPYIVSAPYDEEIINCHWSFHKIEDAPDQAVLHDTSPSNLYNHVSETLIPGQTKTMDELGLSAAYCSGTSISQEFVWSTSDSDIVEVDATTGTITRVTNGTVTIYGIHVLTGKTVQYVVRDKIAFVAGVAAKFEEEDAEYIEDDAYILDTVQRNFSNLGYSVIYQPGVYMNSLAYYARVANIVFLEGHGTQHFIEMSTTYEPKTVVVADYFTTDQENEFLIREYDLSNVELFVFEACSAASNLDGTGTNLCKTAYQMGAQCVLGWADLVYFEDQEIWQARFQEKLQAGWTVEEATRYANSFLYCSFLSVVCPSCLSTRTYKEDSISRRCICGWRYQGFTYHDYNGIKDTRIYGDAQTVISAERASVVDYDDNENYEYWDATELGMTGFEYDLSSEESVFLFICNVINVSNEDLNDYVIDTTSTSEDGDDYILDYILRPAVTDAPGQLYGYTVIVEDNTIIGIRDNSQKISN